MNLSSARNPQEALRPSRSTHLGTLVNDVVAAEIHPREACIPASASHTCIKHSDKPARTDLIQRALRSIYLYSGNAVITMSSLG